MSGGRKRILSPFTVHIKQKAWNKTRENICRNSREIILQSRGMVEEFWDDKSTFYNCREKDDSDNDDEDYNENIEAVAHRCCSK